MDDKRKKQRKKVCLYCGFNIPYSLHTHHLRKGKCITLCANCHYVLHGLFKSQKLKDMSEHEVIEYLRVTYKEFKREQLWG